MGSNLYLTNDTFIGNNATHNGGAVFYIFGNGKGIYRDYNNFDGRGIIDSDGRTTVPFKLQYNNFDNSIERCYFENNFDYLFEVTGSSRNQTAIIRIYVPTDVDKDSTHVYVTVYALNGTEVGHATIDRYNFDNHFNEQLGIFTVEFQNLTEGRNYTVKASFYDAYYM